MYNYIYICAFTFMCMCACIHTHVCVYNYQLVFELPHSTQLFTQLWLKLRDFWFGNKKKAPRV